MSEAPWDPGLQPERTTLAWLRTALALSTAGLTLTRIALERSELAVVLAGGCVVISGLVLARSWSRHLDAVAALRAGRPLGGSLLPAGITTAAVALGLAGAVYVLA